MPSLVMFTQEKNVIDSPQGHDGFLLESAYLGPLISHTVATAEETS